jgi:hypothetical protein
MLLEGSKTVRMTAMSALAACTAGIAQRVSPSIGREEKTRSNAGGE